MVPCTIPCILFTLINIKKIGGSQSKFIHESLNHVCYSYLFFSSCEGNCVVLYGVWYNTIPVYISSCMMDPTLYGLIM